MKKYSDNLPVLDQISKFFKSTSILTDIFRGGAGIGTIMFFGFCGSLMICRVFPLIIALLISGAVAAWVVKSYFNVSSQADSPRIDRMITASGVSSPEELEAILERSTAVNMLCYINDKMIIDFKDSKILRFDEITSAAPYQKRVEDSENNCHMEYGINILFDSEAYDKLTFGNVNERDMAYKIIKMHIS